jgi:hypothetical protein
MGILPGNVNKQASPGQRGSDGSGSFTQQPGVRKLVRVVEGGKLHKRGERPNSHMSYKQTCQPTGAAALSSNQEWESL